MMFSPLIIQIWHVSAIHLKTLADGMGLGFTSSLLLALQHPDSPIKASVETISWLVATVAIGSMSGFAINACLMDNIGRKKTYILCLLPYIAGLTLIYVATDVGSLICGRFLTGISMGATGILGPCVIGEFSAPRYRGMFLNLKTAAFYIGGLIAHAVGHHVHWKTLSLLCMVPVFLAFCISLAWPESPSWLAQRRRFRESEEVFYYLRGTSIEAVREFKEMLKSQNKTNISKTCFEWVVELTRKFTKKNFLKPVLIFVFCAILLETSFRNVFLSFAAQIISKITGSSSELFFYTLAVDIIMTISVILSSYLIKVVNMRTLLFSTGLASCALLSLACLHLFLASKDIISKDYTAVPISLLAFFFVFVNLGCAPIPLTLVGEIFPLEHRAVGTSIASYLFGISFIISLKSMPIMLQTLDLHGSLAVFALCMATTLLVLYFLLPETKNRTLQEIEDFFNHGRFKDSHDAEEDVDIHILCKKEPDST